jgi:Family of unknown function (DUF6200)
MAETKPLAVAASSDDKPQAIVIDLGKQKRKQVRELRRGQGELLDAIQSQVRELQAKGTLPANVPPVIVVVGPKKPRRRLFI